VAYPNPAREAMHFVVKQVQAAPIEIHIYNFKGELVATLALAGQAGINVLDWQCRSAAAGVYLAKIQADSGKKKVKVAVVR